MDKQAFLKKLCEYGMDTNIVCFNDSVKDDVFCVISNYEWVQTTISIFCDDPAQRAMDRGYRLK